MSMQVKLGLLAIGIALLIFFGGYYYAETVSTAAPGTKSINHETPYSDDFIAFMVNRGIPIWHTP